MRLIIVAIRVPYCTRQVHALRLERYISCWVLGAWEVHSFCTLAVTIRNTFQSHPARSSSKSAHERVSIFERLRASNRTGPKPATTARDPELEH